MPEAELMQMLSDALDEFDSPLLHNEQLNTTCGTRVSAQSVPERHVALSMATRCETAVSVSSGSQHQRRIGGVPTKQQMCAEPDALEPDANQLHSVVPDARGSDASKQMS